VYKKLLFHRTPAPGRKPEPFTVNVNSGPPAVAELGERLDSMGLGLLMVKINVLETMPPGFATATVALPCTAIRFASTDAVS